MKRLAALALFLLAAGCGPPGERPRQEGLVRMQPETLPAERTVRVLDLFHPREAEILFPRPGDCRIRCGGALLPSSRRVVVRAAAGGEIEAESRGMTCSGTLLEAVRADGAPWRGEFELVLPQLIRRSYRGGIALRREGESLLIILRVAREDLLCGILRGESAAEDPPEYLAALSVASRSSIAAAPARHGAVDFCDNTHCQVFAGFDRTGARWREAARRTAGNVIAYRGRIVPALFCACCGGGTLPLRAVWSGGDGGYTFPAVSCDACSASAHYRWNAFLGPAEFERIFGAALAATTSVRVDSGGGVEPWSVVMDAGGRRFRRTVDDFRLQVGRTLGWKKILSNRFSLMRTNDRLVFHGAGFGHGVGLCQEGAKSRALAGRAWREILSWYYPGTTIEKRNEGAQTR